MTATTTSPSDLLQDERIRRAGLAGGSAAAFLVLLHVVWGPTAGVVLQGMVIGAITAFISFGIALIYLSLIHI